MNLYLEDVKVGKLYQYPFSCNLRRSPAIDFNIKKLLKAHTPFVALEISESSEPRPSKEKPWHLWLKILTPDGDTSYVLCARKHLKEAR